MRLRTTFGRTATRFTAIGAAALAIVGVTATSAAAGDSVSVEGAYGAATFYDKGDLFAAYDLHADGRSVQAKLKVPYRGKTYSVRASGAGDEARMNLNLAEGATVYLKMCYVDNGTADCGSWHKGVA
ncbi:hypothetical protein GCM10009801_07400 [Streptomyces albiaxialis]|uniref:Secreted protein n=1 Tax=Streptomyces albiaxialis TaxID=329523 RepID=A0ABN2VIS5_9ACTN